jgi:hypothetical protein
MCIVATLSQPVFPYVVVYMTLFGTSFIESAFIHLFSSSHRAGIRKMFPSRDCAIHSKKSIGLHILIRKDMRRLF